jgi:hypothetical protein
MERELTIERTRAGLEVACQLGRKGGRKRQMTDSKIASAKKLLTNGVPPGVWPGTSEYPFQRFTVGFRLPSSLNELCDPFSEMTPSTEPIAVKLLFKMPSGNAALYQDLRI